RERLVIPLLLTLVAPPAVAQTPIALRGATLIDGTDRPPRADVTVVTRGGRIEAVGPSSEVRIPAGARVIDVSGRHIVPGFVDMHGHVALGAWVLDTAGGKRMLRYDYDE